MPAWRARLGSLVVLPAVVVLWGTHWQLGGRVDHLWLLPLLALGAYGLEVFARRQDRLGGAARALRGLWLRWDPLIAGLAIHAVLFRRPETPWVPLGLMALLVLGLVWLRRASTAALVAVAASLLLVTVVLPRAFEAVLTARIAASYDQTVDHRLWPDGKEINSDSVRLRGEADQFGDDDYVVLFLGDSFTFGWSLPYEQSYPYVWESLARGPGCAAPVRAVNMGWTSASPLLALRLLRQVGHKYHPDLVVYSLDMTDFHDDLRYEKQLREQDDLAFDTSAVLERLIATELPWAAGLTPWLREVTDRLRWVDREGRAALIEDLQVPTQGERYFAVQRPIGESRPAIEVGVMQNLDDMYHFTRDVLGAEMALVLYPRAFQVSAREAPRSWEKDVEPLGPWVLEPFRYFESVQDELPYRVVSVLEDFQRSTVFPLFFEADPHWNRNGAALAARAALTRLREAGLVPCTETADAPARE